MDKSCNITKIIKRLCGQTLPQGVFQKGSSRVFLDDNGYYFTMIEFQPYSLSKGTFLNVGMSFLFQKNDYLPFSYSFNNDTRVGKCFIEYLNDAQFEKEVREYVELAKALVLKYRAFADVEFAREYFLNELSGSDRDLYLKSVFCFLSDDVENGQKYYKLFLETPFYKKISALSNLGAEETKMSKEYILGIIGERRKYWRGKASMKKMQINKYDR